MSLTTRVLIGLGLGLALGLALATVLPPSWQPLAAWIEPIGTIWTRALQMTVLPLVITLLYTGVSSSGGGISKIGAKGIAFFVVSLVVVAIATLLVAPAVFAMVKIDPAAAAALREASTAPAATIPSFRDWLVGLMPNNLVQAGASGAMLPIIVATLIFAAAASKLPESSRRQLEHLVEFIGQLTLVVVRGILSLAPIGVFALAVPLALRLGTTAIGAVAVYVIFTGAMSLLVIALLYPVAAMRGVSIRAFARALAPAQGIAISARSSLAALPALIEEGTELGLSDRTTGFFLPFSASLYRLGGAIALPTGVIFIALLYGVPLDASQYLTIGLTSILLTFSVPGIPGGSMLIMAPVLLAVGLPVGGIGILLGVDTIPDMFRTTVNVTGTMTAAVMVDEGDSRPER